MLCRILHQISRALCYTSRQASSTTIVLDRAVIIEDDTGYQLGLFLLDGRLLCLRNSVPEQNKEYFNHYGTFCVWYFRKWQNTAHGAACCKYVVCSVLKQCLSTQHICSTALIPVWSGTHQVNFSKLLERHIFQARCSFCHKHHNDNNDDEKNNNININVVVLLVCIYY